MRPSCANCTCSGESALSVVQQGRISLSTISRSIPAMMSSETL